jgi:uncharacterized membrane protein YqjE
MDVGAPVPGGLLGSLRSLLESLLSSAQGRLELLALELHEEKFRLIEIFIWISAAVFSAVLAITFASVAVVYLFWESARLAVLTGFALFYSAAFLLIVRSFRRYIKRQPKPFEGTIAELKNDRACIRPES